MISFLTKNRTGRPFLFVCLFLGLFACCHSAQARIRWERKILPGPNSGNQQTACVVADEHEQILGQLAALRSHPAYDVPLFLELDVKGRRITVRLLHDGQQLRGVAVRPGIEAVGARRDVVERERAGPVGLAAAAVHPVVGEEAGQPVAFFDLRDE